VQKFKEPETGVKRQLIGLIVTERPRDVSCRWKYCCHSKSLKIIGRKAQYFHTILYITTPCPTPSRGILLQLFLHFFHNRARSLPY